MATTDRTSADASTDLARRVREASFVHQLVRADGAALAAAGLLVAACEAAETPYQASVVRTRDDVEARIGAIDDSTTAIGVGVPDPDEPVAGDRTGPGVDGLADRPSVTAFHAADGLDAGPDPALALAGVFADGGTPEDVAPSIVGRAALERRPGLAAPTADPADALAYSTLAHVPYSGAPAAAEAVVADLGEDDGATDRRLASLLAIDAVSAEGATDRAAGAIERAIHPLAGGPLETIGGFADVLDALAATTPGWAITLALGGDPAPALDAWREHARAAHDGVRSAEVTRHDGLLVARAEGPVEAVARLLRDFRSPEPAVLVVGDGEAALATVDAPARPIEAAVAAVGGSGLARGTTGYARFDAESEDDLVDAVEGGI